ncbi:MAG: cell division protein [Cycloclasticus sp. symbiont of Poecilosclerida sp. M]|nr:MAG: cell division protein [Cycloclasticus sp. symbiont of Poecilosclerida sp. M]
MSYSNYSTRDKANKVIVPELSGRRRFVLACFMLVMIGLIVRAVELQVINNSFLQGKGEAVHLRDIKMPAYRGKLIDREGNALAISAQVSSVWVNPQELAFADNKAEFAQMLGFSEGALNRKLARVKSKRFVYLRRQMDPQVASFVDDLKIPGVYLQKEYKRYYPDGEAVAHLIGFTNIDDQGQEGLELAFNRELKGEDGLERVVLDGKRRMINHVESIRSSVAGKDIQLSIDRRLQYIAHRELKAAVAQHNAKAGSLVLMDPKTGDVLAVANQPAFNPNDRSSLTAFNVRNRAFVDAFEPGSTMKPFTVAAGLESGKYDSSSVIETSPGFYKIGSSRVSDHRNYGRVDLARLLLKSSNVGASKIALDIPREGFWGLLNGLGFGQAPGSYFPGEAGGKLVSYERWRPIEVATLSFGYGLSTSVLQLAQAYSVLANDGIKQPISLVKKESAELGERVMRVDVAQQVRGMLKDVVSTAGTAPRARIKGYSIAGKTGTVKKVVAGGYSDDKYLGVFAGMAPADDPRLVMVVMIDEPRSGDYYGGLVAAPVFARVMSGALRLMNIPPDNVQTTPLPASLEGGIR